MDTIEWIKSFRKSKGMTQKDFAIALGYKAGTSIGVIEARKNNGPGYGALIRVISEFGIRPTDEMLDNAINALRLNPRWEGKIADILASARRLPVWMPDDERKLKRPTTTRGKTLAVLDSQADVTRILEMSKTLKPITDLKMEIKDIKDLQYRVSGQVQAIKASITEQKQHLKSLSWQNLDDLFSKLTADAKQVRVWERDLAIANHILALLKWMEGIKNHSLEITRDKIYQTQLEKSAEAISRMESECAGIAKEAEAVAKRSKRIVNWATRQIEWVKKVAEEIGS